MQIPQLLTSEQCLSCRGCCLFHKPGSDWSPRLTPDDAAALLKAAPGLAWRNGGERIVLKACKGVHACSFLDEGNHHCQVYASRPFECRIYPFLLSHEKEGFKVYAHLSCPAVGLWRAAGGEGAWADQVAMIRGFFSRPEVQAFAHQHAPCFPDYSLAPEEIEAVLAFDPGAALRAEQPRIAAALASRPRTVSSLSFVNMFAWQDFFKFTVDKIDGALCVFASQPVGTFLYWPPLGKDISAACVDACFSRMRDLNRGGSLTRVENVAQDELKFFDSKKYEAVMRGQEYIYARRQIATLRGNAYKSRRGEVNAFERAHGHGHTFRPYRPEDFNGCAELFDRWLDGRFQKHDNDVYRSMLAENRLVHRLILAHAGRLGLVGRVVEIDGRVVAYTFGYALDQGTFCVLFEVAAPEHRGLSAFVFSRFCAEPALEKFEWINAMDDFMAANLEHTKLLWRPARLEPVYTVSEKRGRA